MPATLDWIPPGATVRWTEVGAHGWHAVSLPFLLGAYVLTELGTESGALIQDEAAKRLSWFIPANAADGYEPPTDDVVVITDGGRLYVPGLARWDVVWWCLPPDGTRPVFTAPEILFPAIALATERWLA
ncbi:hypothetical protein ACMA1D_01795 [Streptomyces sp. 796.1]|uniref:hypothetical protein n=1 Tax=Streptomyces sp. 796.1 TaxID=3163029 RepID=UPI0039C91411